MKPDPRIFISVAEQSADEHAAAMIRAFRRLHPAARFAGLAGPAMVAEGCEQRFDLTAKSAMAAAALKRIPEVLRLLGQLKDYLDAESFDAAVMVDSPALNLPIAKLCRQRGIPVLYYIAPQTWAWGPRGWRNARVRRRVNRLACLWPFEEAYFRKAGIAATYVGHPTFERLLATPVDEGAVAALKAEGSPIVTILPGSREHVVREVLPGQLEVVHALASRFRRARFLVVAANEEKRGLIESMLATGGAAALGSGHSGDRGSIKLLCGPAERAAAIRAADLVLAASGTVTLEVAYHATPMIVMYNASAWMYRLVGRWLITTPHFSLPNILAGREIVPEYMPFYRSTDPIIATALEWLSTPTTLARVRKDLADTIRPLIVPGASERAARELEAMIEERGPSNQTRG
jgi:lipid-A-disaccharide synthase